jgi:hypothetical protein
MVWVLFADLVEPLTICCVFLALDEDNADGKPSATSLELLSREVQIEHVEKGRRRGTEREGDEDPTLLVWTSRKVDSETLKSFDNLGVHVFGEALTVQI